MLPKPQSCLSDALLVFLDVTVNLECLEQKTSPLFSESGLFAASPFSDNDVSVGTNCTCELASGFPTSPDILNLWRQVLQFFFFFFKGTLHEADVYFQEEAGIYLWGKTFVSGKV